MWSSGREGGIARGGEDLRIGDCGGIVAVVVVVVVVVVEGRDF